MATTAQIKIDGDASGALGSIRSVEKALGQISRTASSAQQALTAALGAVAGGSLFNFIDQLQNTQNKLRISTKSTEEFASSMEFVRLIADKTGQSLAATGDLYAAVSRNASKLGYDQNQVVTVTNAMATALKASGASAQGSASTLYQFSQILAKGKVNGDEFTTIMENLGGPVMDLVAKNMGLTTEQLVKYKEKGLIGAKDFTDALIRSMGELDTMGGKSAQTLSQSLQRIQNAFADAIIKIDEATGFSQTFADIANKISSNGENLIPVIKTLGLVLAGLALSLSPVITLFTIVAASAIYFADILGPILKPAIAVVEMALKTLVNTIIGFGAAITALVSGENPFDAYTKAVDEFDKKAGTANKNAVEGNKQLAAAANAAASATGKTAGQLSGVSDKYKEILRNLKEEQDLLKFSNAEYTIQQKLLEYNRQLERSMSEEQKNQLIQQLKISQALSAARDYNEMLKSSAAETKALYASTAVEAKVIAEVEQLRKKYGDEIANSYKSQIEFMARQQILAGQINELQKEANKVSNDLLVYGLAYNDQQAEAYLVISKITDQTDAQIAAKLKILSIEREQGIELTDYNKKQILTTETIKAQADAFKRIRSSLNEVNKSLQGPAAGAVAAGQISQLDPLTAAKTANDTLFNGLRYLRQNDLIDEQAYLAARLSANVQANTAIQEANSRMFENKKMYELQNQKDSIFGYQTQKSMAQEAANFQMKSDMEKTAFAIDQTAQMMTSLGSYNKKAFEAAKAFNIANAIMNTYMGATKALATYPPPFNFIAAGAVVAMGLAQVASIRSQQYSGRALGGPVMGNTPYLVGENGPEIFTPNTTGSITRNQDIGGGGTTNVNFTIVANDTAGFDQLLSQRKGLITQIIRDAQLDRGIKSGY